MIESRIQKGCIEWLRLQGCLCYKLGQCGEPDWVVVYHPGRHYFMEFKTEKGKLTRAQMVLFRKLAGQGHNVFIARSLESVMLTCRIMSGNA
jgi:hypothetical protein